jgi:hypothetical protein
VARRTPTIPIATVSGGNPEPSIADTDWQRIETAYGLKLLPGVRKQLYQATCAMLWFVPPEQIAQPVSASRRRVERIKKAAAEFKDAVFENSPDAYGYYENHLFNRRFNDQRVKDRDKLRFLGMLMTSAVVTCNQVLNHLDNPTNHGWQEGETWQLWVQELTSILTAQGLPTGARKDTDKNKTGKPSPFVALIRELQKCIPATFRRSSQSDGALAKSIHESRQARPSGRKAR